MFNCPLNVSGGAAAKLRPLLWLLLGHLLVQQWEGTLVLHLSGKVGSALGAPLTALARPSKLHCCLQGTAVSCNTTGLEKLPASVKDYVSNILAKWSAVPHADSDFLDLLDDADSDGSDEDNSSDDYSMDGASSIGDYSTNSGMDDGPMDGVRKGLG